ncbi:MAG: YfhO family protein [Lachnospiraceae bacterium]|nr:YfhO family protein [Lachnospiraceae bacterium]
MKEYFRKNENRIIWLVTMITLLIACSPLITRYCINGHDIDYHLLRIESLKEGILMGKPFLKINVLFFGGAGYASSLFYPDFLLYIPALLRVMGVSIGASYHIFIFLCFLLSYLSMYYSVSRMMGSKYAGLISAVIMSLCQYHLDDIYVRSAVGEYTAFIFLPLLFYGIYNLLYEDMDKPWLLGAGFGGVLLCHTTSFVMCLLFAFVACILKIKVFKNRRVFLRLLATALITAGISAFYWLPVMEQLLSASFYVSTPWIEPHTEAVRFVKVFYNKFPSLGIIPVILCVPRILIKKADGNKKLLEFADYLMIAGFLFTFLATDLFPWQRLERFLSFIQFPWRFFIMSSVLFSMAAGIILYVISRRFARDSHDIPMESGVCVIVLIMCAIAAYANLSQNDQGYYDYSDDYYDYKPYTANVIGGEWLPDTVLSKETLVSESERLTAADGSLIDFKRVKNTIEAEIDRDSDFIDIPFIYYKGYEAFLEEGGKLTKLSISNEGNNGFIRAKLEPGMRGKLTVRYAGTTAQLISKLLTLISMLIFIIYLILSYRNKKGLRGDK